jgi:hypothetical protein
MSKFNMLVYDAEIAKPIPPRDRSQRLDGMDYCNGWGDRKGMGIAVIAVYDFMTDNFGIYLEEGLKDFKELCAMRDRLLGFNSFTFDNKLLAAHGIELPPEKCLDLYAASRKVGVTASLDKLAKANGLLGKGGSGADAPILWQRGHHSKVINYCINDAYLTKELARKALAGELISPVTGQIYYPEMDLGER